MSVHVFTAAKQPLTSYVEPGFGAVKSWKMKRNPRGIWQCHTCGRLRWAKNMTIQVYYDKSHIACVEGHRWDGRRRRFVTLPETGAGEKR